MTNAKFGGLTEKWKGLSEKTPMQSALKLLNEAWISTYFESGSGRSQSFFLDHPKKFILGNGGQIFVSTTTRLAYAHPLK